MNITKETQVNLVGTKILVSNGSDIIELIFPTCPIASNVLTALQEAVKKIQPHEVFVCSMGNSIQLKCKSCDWVCVLGFMCSPKQIEEKRKEHENVLKTQYESNC